jgi:hypothetical protein
MLAHITDFVRRVFADATQATQEMIAPREFAPTIVHTMVSAKTSLAIAILDTQALIAVC